MSKKTKRAPGGGRKPSGLFARNAAQLTIRMPADMRAELEGAAEKRGWSLTQELLWRLRVSLSKTREDRRDPATRAFCYLISEVSEKVGTQGGKLRTWHRDPFLFRAFRLGIAKLLESLEPAGEVRSPYAKLKPHGSLQQWLVDKYRTPETAANDSAADTLHKLLHSAPLTEERKNLFRTLDLPELPGIGEQLVEMFEDEFYGMSDARRDLGIEPKEPQS
jgi:hypothetical protein